MRKLSAISSLAGTMLACTALTNAGILDDGEWHGSVSLHYQPYSLDLNGNVGFLDFNSGGEISDTLDSFDSTWGLRLDVGTNRYFLDASITQIDLDAEDENVLTGVQVNGEELALNLLVGYTFYEDEELDLELGVMGGISYINIDMDFTSYSILAVSPLQGRTIDFIDPMVGLRAAYGFADGFTLRASGKVGGFTLGSQLHLLFEATVDYGITEWLAVSAGYRYWFWDYVDDSVVQDLDHTVHGPMIGLRAIW